MTGKILSVDIGTSSLKASLIDFQGKLCAFCRTVYGENPDAGSWEKAFARALGSLSKEAPDLSVEAICISGNGPTLVPVTAKGETLKPLYWYGGKEMSKGLSFFLPHVAAFKTNAPALYRKTRYFVSSHEWLASRLGAPIATVLPSKSYEPYYWDDEQCRSYGLDIAKFPPFIEMGKLLGHVSAEASSAFSPVFGNRLKSGTPIISGGPDFITALIGTGTLKPGEICDRAGSSEGLNACADSPVKNVEGIRVLPHVTEGFWNIGVIIPSSGRAFEDYRINSFQQNKSYEELLSELIPSSFLSDYKPNPGSAFPVSSPDYGRSVLCEMGFAVRRALETLEKAGVAVKRMRLSGGQGKNARWNQLKADILGVTLLVCEIPDGELAGNAVLAAAALEGGKLDDKTEKMIRIHEIYEPENRAFWEERYREGNVHK